MATLDPFGRLINLFGKLLVCVFIGALVAVGLVLWGLWHLARHWLGA